MGFIIAPEKLSSGLRNNQKNKLDIRGKLGKELNTKPENSATAL